MDFKRILIIGILIVSTFVFSACGGFSPLDNNPGEYDMVYSNGGIAVQKGEYLYYANGFLSHDDIKSSSDNSFGDVQYSAIYRTKLNNGNLVFDDDGVISNSECVVPKVVGHESCNFYIFNNNIFYTTPNVQKNKYGELQNELLNFCMARVSGASTKVLYTTESELSNVKYGMKKYGDSVYLIILDGTDLKEIVIKDGSASSSKILAEDVSDAIWTTQSNYDANANYNNAFDSFVYYTTSAEEGAGNILKKVSIVSGEQTTLINDNATTFTLKAIGSDRIYYTTKVGTISNRLYSNTLTATDVRDSQSGELLNSSFSNFYAVKGGNNDYVGGILVSDSTNGSRFISCADNSVKILSSSDAYHLLFNNGSKIYVRTSASMIYEIDLSQTAVTPKEILSTEENAKVDANKYVDYTNRYVLYFGEYKNSQDATKYYTHIVDLGGELDENNLPNNYLLASLLDEDILDEE